MGKVNLHLYQSDFRNESRILRETKAITSNGIADECVIAAAWSGGLKEEEAIDGKRRVWRLKVMGGKLPAGVIPRILGLAVWSLKILSKFIGKEVAMVNCHSIAALPSGVMFKIFWRSKLVYDAHELETETANSRGLRKKIAKIVERSLVGMADMIVVVCESAAEWYHRSYRFKKEMIATVRNIPVLPEGPLSADPQMLKNKLGIKKSELLFIYQGLLVKGRGIGLALEAFSELPADKHIVFMGYGNLEAEIIGYSKKYRNIHFLPAVKPEVILNYTVGADVGLCLIEDLCLNYKLSLPNKLFEYILAGVPVIGSDFPEIGRVIDECDAGWKISPSSVSLKDIVKKLDLEEIENKKISLNSKKSFYSWENEEKKLVKAYRSFYLPNK